MLLSGCQAFIRHHWHFFVKNADIIRVFQWWGSRRHELHRWRFSVLYDARLDAALVKMIVANGSSTRVGAVICHRTLPKMLLNLLLSGAESERGRSHICVVVGSKSWPFLELWWLIGIVQGSLALSRDTAMTAVHHHGWHVLAHRLVMSFTYNSDARIFRTATDSAFAHNGWLVVNLLPTRVTSTRWSLENRVILPLLHACIMRRLLLQRLVVAIEACRILVPLNLHDLSDLRRTFRRRSSIIHTEEVAIFIYLARWCHLSTMLNCGLLSFPGRENDVLSTQTIYLRVWCYIEVGVNAGVAIGNLKSEGLRDLLDAIHTSFTTVCTRCVDIVDRGQVLCEVKTLLFHGVLES